MKKHLKWLSAVLLCTLIGSVFLGTTVTVSAAGTFTVSVQNGTGTRGPIRADPDLGYRAKVNAPFTAFSIAMPTWSTTDSSCTISLLKWAGSYEATIKGQPLAAKDFNPLKDNATNTLTFDAQPAGEYLFYIHNPSGSVGVWGTQGVKDSLGFTYINGMESTDQPELRITFTDRVEEPFGACASAKPLYDGNHKAPPAYILPDDSAIKTHPVMPDTWVFTDGLGRTSLTNADVGDPRDDKTVGIFYWTWHTEQGHHKAFNNQAFLEKYPEALNDFDHPGWPKVGEAVHAWNEPIYGHYKNTDDWVVRRQGELLANAGIDAIFTDNTNGTFTWRSSYMSVFETWTKAMEDGVNTPKVSFMLPFAPSPETGTQLRSLYADIYHDSKFQPLWFYWDKKPMLMAHGTRTSLNNGDNLDKEILNFFTFRHNYPGYTNARPKPGDWGWLSVYPQAVYYASRDDAHDKIAEQTTVGVAMNHDYKLNLLAPMNGRNITGRSYTSTGYHTEPDAKLYGYNFAEQWNYALEIDPKMVFITGWNEWIAGRYSSWPPDSPASVENAFPDQCNDEFSRDIEPTKGDLKDHYYYQMVNFIRKYKGCRPIPLPGKAASIDIQKDNAQWNSVEPYFGAYMGNTGDRDAKGYADERYTEYSGRNDIIGARVARDEENVYFYVECKDAITPCTDPLWMTLYIDSDQQNQGWETFDYVINKKSPTATEAYLEKFTGQGYATEEVGKVSYTVNGSYMQIAVPKALLGLSGYDFTLNFTWTDNVHDAEDKAADGDTDFVYSAFSGDIMDFYISGDVAPSGRFKYSYISTAQNAGMATETETETDTETTAPDTTTVPDTTEAPADTTEAPATETPAETEKPSSGCHSVLGLSAALCAVIPAALLLRKKKHDD